MDADQNMVISAPGSDQFRMRTMKKEGVSERSLLVVSIALAIAQVWINRYAVNGDAIPTWMLGTHTSVATGRRRLTAIGARCIPGV